MSELEQEKLESDKRVTQLQQSLDTAKASLKHHEKLEVIPPFFFSIIKSLDMFF